MRLPVGEGAVAGSARREALREYVRGALWLFPSIAVVVALLAGSVLSLVAIPPDSALAPLVFQGTPDDARALLIGIAGSVITVVAVTLGLSVVALQLASTQFSPRLLRNFLQDRPNQLVLSVLVATFTYSTAGLFTVGVSQGARTDTYPRLAVSGALLLLFASLGALLYFVDHLLHSIQIDAITKRVQDRTLRVVFGRLPGARSATVDEEPPLRAVPLLARQSGYVQTLHPDVAARRLARRSAAEGLVVHFVPRVGDHVAADLPLAWAWSTSPGAPAPDAEALRADVGAGLRLGFERTLEQDAALGIRQLADIGSKALSPAINDPYTAVQAIDRLTVVFMALSRLPLGDEQAEVGSVRVVAPGIRFDEYARLSCAQIRRYGCHEPAVVRRLLHLLDCVGATVAEQADRRAVIARHVRLLLADAERAMKQPADFEGIRGEGAAVLARLAGGVDAAHHRE